MKKQSIFTLWFCASALVFGLKAARADYSSQAFPPAHELFAPLLADPTELHFAFEMGTPVRHHAVARVDAGDYLGIYRWALPSDIGAAQVNIGGAVNSRFDATTDHDLQVIDYYGNVPLDVRIGPLSGRLLFYHDSSHLGDDYLREKGIVSENHSWEALKGLLSAQPINELRVYAGYTNAYHTKPDWKEQQGPNAVQGGAEVYFIPSSKRWIPYWANDVQSWQRSAWNVTWTSQLGIKAATDYARGRGMSYYIQCMTGPRLEGQFYSVRETVWSAGLRFDLSSHLVTPAQEPAPRTSTPKPEATMPPTMEQAPATPPPAAQ